MKSISSQKIGPALEAEVLGIFERFGRGHYEAKRNVKVTSPLSRAAADIDLMVVYHQGDISYSILVECKASLQKRGLDKGVIFNLASRVRHTCAQVGILVATQKLQSGAIDALEADPNLLFSSKRELIQNLKSGALDQKIPKLANAVKWRSLLLGDPIATCTE